MSPLLLLRPRRHAEPVTRPDRPPANVLSTEKWSAAVFSRGGGTKLGELAFSSVSGERVRGVQASRAQATIPGAIAKACEPLLVSMAAHPWAHELHVYRGTNREWLGPVRKLTFPEGTGDVTIEASDLLAWPGKRRLPAPRWFSEDAAGVYAKLVAAAFEVDESPNATIEWAPIGVAATRSYIAGPGASEKLIAPLLSDLEAVGVEATAIERVIYVGDAIPVPLRTIRLTDDHFTTRPGIVVDGDQQANDIAIAGGPSSATSDPVQVVVTEVVSEEIDGVLQDVVREANLNTPALAAARGELELSLRSSAPVQFSGGSLAQNAPVLFSELIPGAVLLVALANTVAPVAGAFVLTRVSFKASPKEETISIEVQPA